MIFIIELLEQLFAWWAYFREIINTTHISGLCSFILSFIHSFILSFVHSFIHSLPCSACLGRGYVIGVSVHVYVYVTPPPPPPQKKKKTTTTTTFEFEWHYSPYDSLAISNVEILAQINGEFKHKYTDMSSYVYRDVISYWYTPTL